MDHNLVIEDRLLKVTEAARLTGLSVGTIYHYVSQGRIPVVRLSKRCIRFLRSDLLKWWAEMSSSRCVN